MGSDFEFSPVKSETAFAEELFINGQIRSSYHQQIDSVSSNGRKQWFSGPEKKAVPLTAPAKKVYVRYDEREIMEKPVNWSPIQSRRSTQNRRKSFLPYTPGLLGCHGSVSGVVVDCHYHPELKRRKDP
ncbi:hypothetical protein SUGI_0299830 [Cryptomeria japonica]|nr:hypothetical protein SUGI_0299830 [Cryptomeria japonica]